MFPSIQTKHYDSPANRRSSSAPLVCNRKRLTFASSPTAIVNVSAGGSPVECEVPSTWLCPEDYAATKMDMAQSLLQLMNRVEDAENLLNHSKESPDSDECFRGLEPHVRTIILKQNNFSARRKYIKAIVQYHKMQQRLRVVDGEKLRRLCIRLTHDDRARARAVGYLDALEARGSAHQMNITRSGSVSGNCLRATLGADSMPCAA